MFWQFANHIIATNDAKRFYPTLGMIGNLGLVLAGNVIVYFADITGSHEALWQSVFLGKSYAPSEVSLKLVVMIVVLSGLVAMFLLRYIHKVVLHNNLYLAHHDVSDTQTKLSVRESIKLIMGSRYIGYIVVMIVCYGLVINILEGPWKAKVRELYPTTQEYMTFMGNFNICMGISSVFFMLIGSNLLRKFSWFFSAIITPSIIGLTGTMFFIFVVFEESFREFLGGIAFNPIYAAVMVGALQNILSKSTKYSLFDSTKEMAYIPLSKELRTKGKAAAEIIGAKLGKSSGAFIQSTIFILVPAATFDAISPILMVIFLAVIALWVADVRRLGVKYNQIMGEK